MFKAYLAGEIYVHPSCKGDVHTQIIQYRPLRRDNTDGILDLLTYAPRVMEMYAEFIVSLNVLNQEDFLEIKVQEADENCCF